MSAPDSLVHVGQRVLPNELGYDSCMGSTQPHPLSNAFNNILDEINKKLGVFCLGIILAFAPSTSEAFTPKHVLISSTIVNTQSTSHQTTTGASYENSSTHSESISSTHHNAGPDITEYEAQYSTQDIENATMIFEKVISLLKKMYSPSCSAEFTSLLNDLYDLFVISRGGPDIPFERDEVLQMSKVVESYMTRYVENTKTYQEWRTAHQIIHPGTTRKIPRRFVRSSKMNPVNASDLLKDHIAVQNINSLMGE